ncbi:MAG TPA: hypothetical protein VF786_11560 [Terriglobales bacterium]
MYEQTSIRREEASTLLSELKSLYSAMPAEFRDVVRLLIASGYSEDNDSRAMGHVA